MRANVRLFVILGVFFLVADAAYLIWSLVDHGSVEWVGQLGIALSAILVFFIGFFLSRSYSAQGGELPEDRVDANIDDGDPELGFFSPWSWWPLVLGASAALGFLGLAVGFWIMFIAVGLFLVAITGWVYEYYRGYHAR